MPQSGEEGNQHLRPVNVEVGEGQGDQQPMRQHPAGHEPDEVPSELAHDEGKATHSCMSGTPITGAHKQASE